MERKNEIFSELCIYVTHYRDRAGGAITREALARNADVSLDVIHFMCDFGKTRNPRNCTPKRKHVMRVVRCLNLSAVTQKYVWCELVKPLYQILKEEQNGLGKP